VQRKSLRLLGVGDVTRRWGPGLILLALGVACAYQTDEPVDYGSAPTTGSGAALGTTSDDTGSESSSTLGGSNTVTVTLGSSNSSSTDGTASASTDTTSTTGSTSDGGSGGTTSSSGGTTSTTTSDGGTGGTAGSGSGGDGGDGSGGNAGSSGNGGVSGAGGTSQASAFRYARLVALTSQNGAPFTAIAELDLLDANGQPISRSGWTASADTEEIDDETAPASQAIDGDTETFWHSEWGDYEAPFPHYLQIDLGSAAEITGFTYTPRQDGQENGLILDWEFYLSNSANDPGAALDSGSFASGDSPKTVNLP
jgi:hypothetical protein